MSYDGGLLERVYVDRFHIDGNSVFRIAPVARFAEDFVDEWLDLPEVEAMRWVDAEARNSALEWHRKLQDLHKNWGGYQTEYDLRQRCPDKKVSLAGGLLHCQDWQEGSYAENIRDLFHRGRPWKRVSIGAFERTTTAGLSRERPGDGGDRDLSLSP